MKKTTITSGQLLGIQLAATSNANISQLVLLASGVGATTRPSIQMAISRIA